MNTKPIAMRDAFLDRIWRAMASDADIFFLSADFGSPVLDKIREQFPDRFINVGIAEQNLINVSAGLALEGYKVFAYAIAPFITMRCYEQIRVSVALLSKIRPMNITLIGVGAGYSYVVSGPTHQCYEDLTVMRALPSVAVYSPADYVTAAALFDQCLAIVGPKYLRLDAQVLPALYTLGTPDVDQGFNVHRSGSGICIVATGYMVHVALKIAERLESGGIDVGVVDLFDITGFNSGHFEAALKPYVGVVTMEEGFRGRGGLDAMMFDFLTQRQMEVRMLNIGVQPEYRFELGTRADLHERVGIGADVVEKNIRAFAKNLNNVNSLV